MENNDALKEIDVNNRSCFYFEDIMRVLIIYKILILIIFYLTKNRMKIHRNIFWFMTFYTKLLWVQNICVLGLIK